MLATTITFLTLATICLASLEHVLNPQPLPDRYPRRTIAGVQVIDTPLIRAAETFARSHADDTVYKHVMRSWLLGTLLLDHNATLAAAVDPEVHAAAILLHDLGFDRDPDSPVVSHDRRFEIDGAVAARDFIRAHGEGKGWEERRVQLVWDAIALHTEHKINPYKEAEVAVVASSILLDFTGPGLGVTEDEYAAVAREFPNADLIDSVVDSLSWLCRTKPETTYDTFMQPYGERFVEGYHPVGHRAIDGLLGQIEDSSAVFDWNWAPRGNE
ncbi:hypothetical protein NKR19_g6998 [Coniochaeta hoffmannii]|uniref:HD domain-containing protein n=1 Tax=Coniochaeta hoffmannii TaxID=91930 RepID=A0AA38RNQ8_9PEZI|nr:hypothetical protein NKR19_g6998 [Coniochaeta hoffmannii]